MQNILLHLAYDGSPYAGFQEQEGQDTIALRLREALEAIVSHPLRLIAAGRTDRGVHADDQVVNFLTRSDLPAQAFRHLLAQKLPSSILCTDSRAAGPNFHARFDALAKEYRYVLDRGPSHPLYRNFLPSYTYPIDLGRLRQAAGLMVGEHDFSAFSIQEAHRTSMRRMEKVEVLEEGSRLVFRIRGRSFLRRQVRMMVGALLTVGRGLLSLQEIEEALEKGGEAIAFAMPAKGLVLETVTYPKGLEMAKKGL